MDLYTHIIIRLPYIINMAPYTEIIKRHHTAALKQAMGYMATYTTDYRGYEQHSSYTHNNNRSTS